MIPASTATFYNDQLQRKRRVRLLVAQQWRGMDGNFDLSWLNIRSVVIAGVSEAQLNAAIAGSAYGAKALAEQGVYQAPKAWINPEAFAGWAPEGDRLGDYLDRVPIVAKRAIAGGVTEAEALVKAGSWLQGAAAFAVSDAGRQAQSVDIAVRPKTGYARMLNPPSCARCTILAGRFYRWNKGFLRHPNCDCVHIPTQEAISGDVTTDPYAYFESLSKAEQNKIFTNAGAEAIRDGADIYRVTNAKRGTKGVRKALTTTEGTSKRGYASHLKGKRLTPDGIYAQAKSRDEARALLEQYGYILPGGQVPGGSILGSSYQGFGRDGRGGTRVGVRQSVLDAREAGIRRLGDSATMTAAEGRLHAAQLRFEAVVQGRNPLGKGPLTPKISAQVEADYRRWLNTNGEIFTN